MAGCTAAPKTEQVTPATPTTSATTETSADPAAATDLSGKKVALVLSGTNFDYFVYIGAGAKKSAEEAGIQLDVLTTNDLVELSEKISQVITIKYDACIVIGTPMFMADYQALGEAGIPVITYDSMVDGFDFSARVGSDNYVLGILLINRVISNFEFPVNFSPRRDLSIKSRILFISGNLIKFGSNISRLKNRQIHVARKPDSLSK